MFVLDANVISELRNPAKADPKVLAWASIQPIAAQFSGPSVWATAQNGADRAAAAATAHTSDFMTISDVLLNSLATPCFKRLITCYPSQFSR